MQYRREIDGLRAVAVVPVVLFHAGFDGFTGGFVGVDVFFVISGYLITTIIIDDIQKSRFSIIGFYERRARRILPALFVVMAACIPFAWLWMLPYQLVNFSDSLVAVSTFSSNILFWREIGYFGAAAAQKPLLHTWSLAIEEQYYVVVPLFIWFVWRSGRKWLLAAAFAAIGLVSLAVSEWMWRHYVGANFYLIPSRAWELMIGSMISVLGLDRVGPSSGPVGQLASLVGLAMIAASVVLFNNDTPNPSVYTLIPTLGAALIIVYGVPTTAVGWLLGRPPMVGIGLTSYSVYLWHQPLFAFARLKNNADPSVVLSLALIGATFLLAYLTWRHIEQRFRNKKLVMRRTIFTAAPACAIVAIAVGAFGHAERGFVSRYPQEDRNLISFDPVTMGRYVAARFEGLKLQPFGRGEPKVLIVGDSFAEDFVNAIAESGHLNDVSISTHEIGSECGALISKRDFGVYVKPEDREGCAKQGRYSGTAVRKLIKQADVVILASKWLPWQAGYVEDTVNALHGFGAKRVIVIGRKSFGEVSPLNYLGLTSAQKAAVRNKVDPEQRTVNDEMEKSLPASEFVDIQELLCGDKGNCPVFTPGGRLISFDGNHLTPAGAAWMGKILSRSKLLAPFKML